MRYENENIWLMQKMMAALYDISVAAVNQLIKKIFHDVGACKDLQGTGVQDWRCDGSYIKISMIKELLN